MKKIVKVFLFLVLILSSFTYTIKWLSTKDLVVDSKTLDLLLESSGSIKPQNRVINEVVNTIKNTELLNPVSLILNDYKKDKEKNIISVPIIKENNDPIIYIYNTHQKEMYSSPKEININYSVLDASFYLQKKLKEYDIESIVETSSIQDVLNTNNWNYATSYRVSRMFMEKRKSENNSINYYIDLHRDSVNKKISTVTINGKNYAKTMFLLGLENPNYKENKIIMEKLEKYLNDNYKGLSRGIYEKQGKGVNGVYNQDYSKNCILIEVGGEENTFEEVENTIDVIAEMLSYLVGGNFD